MTPLLYFGVIPITFQVVFLLQCLIYVDYALLVSQTT